jgi:nucleotide-binding universal stress UspA family protein
MTPKTVLVPIDFSQPAERALDYACALAAKLGATVHIVNALGSMPPELTVTLSDARLRQLRDDHVAAVAKLADPRRALCAIGDVVVREGDARDVILAEAKHLHVDLIVMGTHGRSGLPRLVLGSVAEDVSRHASCPVLLVRMQKGSES